LYIEEKKFVTVAQETGNGTLKAHFLPFSACIGHFPFLFLKQETGKKRSGNGWKRKENRRK